MDLSEITSDQVRIYKTAFNKFDPSSSGTVSSREVGLILRYVGHNPTEAELQDLINAVDKNGNGSIDFPEFLLMMSIKMHDSNYEDKIREAFKDGNGYIDRREFALMLRFSSESFSPEEIEAVMEEADGDGNGMIDYAEFFTLMSAAAK